MSESILSKEDVERLMFGACFLGAGGGGSLRMAGRVKDTLFSLNPARMVELKDVPDDADLCFVAGVGAPSSDDPEFLNSPLRCLEELEKLTGKTFQYVIPGETGAMNSLLPLLVAARSGNRVRVVDADGAGRALPQLQMSTFALKGISCDPAVVANERGDFVPLYEKSPEALDRKVRELLKDNQKFSGGAVMLASFAMTGKQVKDEKSSVPSALRTAIEVGAALRLPGDDRIKRILKIFADMGRSAIILEQGIVTCVSSKQTDGFDVGRAILVDKGMPFGCFFEIDFVNENLAVRQHLANTVYPFMAPRMFCYLSPEGIPLSNADLAGIWEKGDLNIPIMLFGIDPPPAIDTEQEAMHFKSLYEKYFGKTRFEYQKEPDWDKMKADAARLKCGLRLVRA